MNSIANRHIVLFAGVCVIVVASSCWPVDAARTQPSDEGAEDFEAQQVGEFPSGWRCVREISVPVTAPETSATVVETTSADGTETRAVQFADTVSTSCGIFKEIGQQNVYEFTTDVRIDRWSNSSRPFFTDWAIALGVMTPPANKQSDFNAAPQAMFVAQPVSKQWVFYALRTDPRGYDFYNIKFDGEVQLDTWYRVHFKLDAQTGKTQLKVIDLAADKITLEKTVQIPNWTANKSGLYTHWGTFDGEYNTDATKGNVATVDNIDLKMEANDE